MTSAETLAPGESCTLSVGWKFGSRRGKTAENVLVDYRIESGVEGGVGLQLRADVQPDIEYEPKELTFDPADPKPLRVVFRPGRMADFRLTRAIVEHPSYRATLLSADRTVTVVLDKSVLGYADYGIQLAVYCDSKHEPRINIPVRLKVWDSSFSPEGSR